MINNKNLAIKENFALALKNHQNNNLKVAENLYKEILKIDSSHIDTLNNLGLVFQVLGESEKAINCYEKVIKINPNFVPAYFNLGNTFSALNDYQKTIGYYEKVIEIDPSHKDAHNNLGVVFNELGEPQKAINCYEKVIEIDPSHKDAYNNLGVVFKKLGKSQKAINCYENVIKIDPSHKDAHYNLGVVFQELGKSQKAINCYEKVIKIDPNYADAHNNLGAVFFEIGEYQNAISSYEKALKVDSSLVRAQSNISNSYIGQLNLEKAIITSYKALKMHHENSEFINQSVSLFRLKHDVQLAKYLCQTGNIGRFFKSNNFKINGIDEFQKVGNEILGHIENKEDENNYNKKILLTKSETDALLPFYKSDLIYQPKIISSCCINPNKNWQKVEDEYLNYSKQIIYIDDFLSNEALKELRKFCLVSKIWNSEYDNKYLGAFSDSGFISPIHLQIAIDLQQKLPKLFGPHRLGKFWGFKYDSTLGKGTNIHADFAIHNLNFWITPDEYNNNKNSGGLKVYDAPAPDNWTFKEYNTSSNKIYKFLDDNNAKCTNIPYKFNRAVLFNSAYFHETDEIDFKDEYEGRRINNTYLFGNRLVKTKN